MEAPRRGDGPGARAGAGERLMMTSWRRRTDDDFSDEVQAHLDLETDRLVADGWSPDAARDAARRAFGNVTTARERFYEATRWMWFEQFVQDLRYAWRGLRHSRAFLATTVLTLAVGLGLVTVAFTVFNAGALRNRTTGSSGPRRPASATRPGEGSTDREPRMGAGRSQTLRVDA
jgi:hypothetical protein